RPIDLELKLAHAFPAVLDLHSACGPQTLIDLVDRIVGLASRSWRNRQRVTDPVEQAPLGVNQFARLEEDLANEEETGVQGQIGIAGESPRDADLPPAALVAIGGGLSRCAGLYRALRAGEGRQDADGQHQSERCACPLC